MSRVDKDQRDCCGRVSVCVCVVQLGFFVCARHVPFSPPPSAKPICPPRPQPRPARTSTQSYGIEFSGSHCGERGECRCCVKTPIGSLTALRETGWGGGGGQGGGGEVSRSLGRIFAERERLEYRALATPMAVLSFRSEEPQRR